MSAPFTPSAAAPDHHVIEYVHVSTGYLAGTRIAFSPGINLFVGERGAGKSTIIEALRFTLDLPVMPELAKTHHALMAANVGSGPVTVGIRTKHGARYTVTRALGGKPSVSDAEGRPVQVSLSSDLFKLRVLGQGEMAASAQSKSALLRLIDTFLPDGGRSFFDEMAVVDRRLASSATELLAVMRDIADDEDRASELPTLLAALEGLGSRSGVFGSVAHLFTREAHRARERARVALASRELAEIRTALDGLGRAVKRRLSLATDDGDSPPLVSELRALRDGIAEALANAGARVAESAAIVAHHEPSPDSADANAALTAFVREHPEHQALAAERARLEARIAEVSLVAARLEERRREYAVLLKQRRPDVETLLDLRKALYQARAEVIAALAASLDEELLIALDEAADVDAYVGILTDILQGQRLSKDFIVGLAKSIPPHALAAAILANDPQRLEQADDSKTTRADRARKLLDGLRASRRVFEIETIAAPDIVSVRIKHGAKHKMSDSVSGGQQATSVLPILLRGGEGPLVMDQPEDAIDKPYIHDQVIPFLLDRRHSQQFILATHDQNLSTLTDADRAFHVVSTGEQSGIGAEGTARDLRSIIERLGEGSLTAFEKRAAFYGYEIKKRE